jgi:small nuclear ribonucleoprotein (snRNP)-like protein
MLPDPLDLIAEFLDSRVLVKAAYKIEIEGKLVRVDLSGHNGALGNVIVEGPAGPVLIRGDQVHAILKKG